MTYDEIYQQTLSKYNESCKQYEAIVDTPEYERAFYDAPFSMLRVLFLADRIDVFSQADSDKKPTFQFESIQEAISTYNDITHFDECICNLLDQASLIVSADAMAKNINDYVMKSDYLDNSLCLHRNDTIVTIARNCLTMLPKCEKNITPELKLAMHQAMMCQFEAKYIVHLAQKGIFSKEDTVALLKTPLVNENYQKNLDVLCKGFGISDVPIKEFDVNIKGVTFRNKDGSSRQEFLKEIAYEINERQNTPVITLLPNTFTPEVGAPEASVAVMSGDKCLGFLPKDVAKDLDEKYKDKTLTAQIIKVVGGGDVSYGMQLHIEVCDPLDKEQETPSTQQEAVAR